MQNLLCCIRRQFIANNSTKHAWQLTQQCFVRHNSTAVLKTFTVFIYTHSIVKFLLKWYFIIIHYFSAVFEPLGGVYIGPGERADYKPSLFVMSCGEGHLDLRTADKVMQTVHAQESGKPGVPSAASIISEKNYIMVWDVLV